MIGWRGTDGDTEPVKFECEEWGYPHRTSTDERMYVNTHFQTEEEAWESILASVHAGVNLVGREVERHRAALTEAEKRAGRAAMDYSAAHRKYEEWKLRQRE